MRHQRGYVYRKAGAWYVRYSDQGRQRAQQLGRIDANGVRRGTMTLARVQIRLLEQHRQVTRNGGFGSARAVALADAIALLQGRRAAPAP
jgi:hypothetical protein